MTQIKKECRIDFYNYEDSKFLFSYESNGEDVTLEVNVVDGEDGFEFQLNGQSIGLTPEDFIGCEDIDDCTLVIAKHIIKNNDGEVLTTFVDESGNTLTGISYEKKLTKDLEYDNGDLEDDSLQVTLCANCDNDVSSYDYYDIPADVAEEIVNMISDGDTDALYDAICEYDRNTVEVFDLFNDEELSYDITDENGEEVESGTIIVSTSNIFSYEDPNCETIVNSENHPEYPLIVSDVMKRSSSTFYVPRDFQIGEIHFLSTPLADMDELYWDRFGEETTIISAFRYRGKTYNACDFCDAGNLEDLKFAIFQWNDERKRYDLLAEM